MFIYNARISKESDGSWFVEFPSFEGCFAGAKTQKKAIDDAASALQLVIADYIDRGQALPVNKFDNDNYPLIICVDVDDDFINYSKCMTVSEAAKELGVSKARVSQMLNVGLLESYMYGKTRMVTISSINRRKSEDIKSGRPAKISSLNPVYAS